MNFQTGIMEEYPVIFTGYGRGGAGERTGIENRWSVCDY